MNHNTEIQRDAHLIILSGDARIMQDQLRAKTGKVADAVTAIEEKAISRFGEMLRVMRTKPKTATMCFGCKNLELQRYQFVLKAYLLLSGASQRFLIDGRGEFIRVSWIFFLLVDTPKFLLELFASAGILMATTVKLLWLRQSVGRKL